MADRDELVARMSAHYDTHDCPSWPNPHGASGIPDTDSYERVTDPDRYGVLHARARSWVAALSALPDIEVEELTSGGRATPAALRLRSARSGTVPLVVVEDNVPLTGQEGSLPTLTLGVHDPEVVVERLPDCGCDACDSGSFDLLSSVDQTILAITTGPFVALRADHWHATWHPDGYESGSTRGRSPSRARLLRWCRRLAAGGDVRLPRGTAAYVGTRGWFDES